MLGLSIIGTVWAGLEGVTVGVGESLEVGSEVLKAQARPSPTSTLTRILPVASRSECSSELLLQNHPCLLACLKPCSLELMMMD